MNLLIYTPFLIGIIFQQLPFVELLINAQLFLFQIIVLLFVQGVMTIRISNKIHKKGRLSYTNGTFITVFTSLLVDIIAKGSQECCK